MAQYSFHGQIIGRGSRSSIGAGGAASGKTAGRASVVASAAYRAGARLFDERHRLGFDYTRKGGVAYAAILLPRNAPARYRDRQTLWNAVEQVETRRDAQLAREIMVALPRELTRQQNITLLRDYVQSAFVSRGMAADIAMHDPRGDNHNPHAHIMLTMRSFTADGDWCPQKERAWNQSELFCAWRESWARYANEHLQRAGIDARIDHRSYAEQGIDRLPTVHLGKAAAALERAGVLTDKGRYNRCALAHNDVAELGFVPDGLRDALDGIFHKARSRQRALKSARRAEPSLRPAPSPGAPSAGSDRRAEQRRTYTLLRNAVRQGTPLHPDGDEKRPCGEPQQPLRRQNLPGEASPGERSAAQKGKAAPPVATPISPQLERWRQRAAQRSKTHRTVVAHNFMISHGIKSYDDILRGLAEVEQCHQSQAAAYRQVNDLLVQTARTVRVMQTDGLLSVNEYAARSAETQARHYRVDALHRQLCSVTGQLKRLVSRLESAGCASIADYGELIRQKLPEYEQAKAQRWQAENLLKVAQGCLARQQAGQGASPEFAAGLRRLAYAGVDVKQPLAQMCAQLTAQRDNALAFFKLCYGDAARAKEQFDAASKLSVELARLGCRDCKTLPQLREAAASLNRLRENALENRKALYGELCRLKEHHADALALAAALRRQGLAADFSSQAGLQQAADALRARRDEQAPQLVALKQEAAQWRAAEVYAREVLGVAPPGAAAPLSPRDLQQKNTPLSRLLEEAKAQAAKNAEHDGQEQGERKQQGAKKKQRGMER